MFTIICIGLGLFVLYTCLSNGGKNDATDGKIGYGIIIAIVIILLFSYFKNMPG